MKKERRVVVVGEKATKRKQNEGEAYVNASAVTGVHARRVYRALAKQLSSGFYFLSFSSNTSAISVSQCVDVCILLCTKKERAKNSINREREGVRAISVVSVALVHCCFRGCLYVVCVCGDGGGGVTKTRVRNFASPKLPM